MSLDELQLNLLLFSFSVLNKVALTAGRRGENIRKHIRKYIENRDPTDGRGGERKRSNDNGIMVVVRRGAVRHHPFFKLKTGFERMG